MSARGQPWKLIIVGNKGVGKSSFLQRFAEDAFIECLDDDIIPLDVYETSLEIGGEAVPLIVQVLNLTDSGYAAAYQDANAAILIFATDNKESFLALPDLLKEIRFRSGDIPVALVQSKIDLIDHQTSVLEASQVNEFAKAHKLRLYRVSAKEDLNICDVFLYLGEKCLGSKHQLLSSGGAKGLSARQTSSPIVSSRAPGLGESAAQLHDQEEPLKRRTGGKKPPINKHKCPVM